IGAGPQPARQFEQVRDAVALRHRHQPALDQILLFRRQRQARALLQELADEVEVVAGHPCLPKARMTADAMSGSGRTWQHNPACATVPGMPQTMLVASSCAMMPPPAATMSAPPLAPSTP